MTKLQNNEHTQKQ